MVEGELALALFGSVCVLLLFGFPVALTLAGTALLFAAVGVIAGHFDASFVAALSGVCLAPLPMRRLSPCRSSFSWESP